MKKEHAQYLANYMIGVMAQTAPSEMDGIAPQGGVIAVMAVPLDHKIQQRDNADAGEQWGIKITYRKKPERADWQMQVRIKEAAYEAANVLQKRYQDEGKDDWTGHALNANEIQLNLRTGVTAEPGDPLPTSCFEIPVHRY